MVRCDLPREFVQDIRVAQNLSSCARPRAREYWRWRWIMLIGLKTGTIAGDDTILVVAPTRRRRRRCGRNFKALKYGRRRARQDFDIFFARRLCVIKTALAQRAPGRLVDFDVSSKSRRADVHAGVDDQLLDCGAQAVAPVARIGTQHQELFSVVGFERQRSGAPAENDTAEHQIASRGEPSYRAFDNRQAPPFTVHRLNHTRVQGGGTRVTIGHDLDRISGGQALRLKIRMCVVGTRTDGSGRIANGDLSSSARNHVAAYDSCRHGGLRAQGGAEQEQDGPAHEGHYTIEG
jgi:hypothetical protein